MRVTIFRTIVVAGVCGVAAAGAQDTLPSADAVLRELKAGNDHHVAKRYQHPHQSAARQRELSSGQQPHAIILSCADSRVAPEIILDQGLGDLFDVRVAGNVAGDAELASIEYAALHLHTPLLVVMGHQKCGAVTAAAEEGQAEGHLPPLLAMIRPAIEKARGQAGDLVDHAVQINVENVVRQIRTSRPVLGELVDRGGLRVVGAVYSLDTGRVAWLPETPQDHTGRAALDTLLPSCPH
ncbi:MAG TPA: carbonic anhydrase [Vicinamibacterales bacterium]|nr:carbonic anhydrase [Vicinamibacterales bacterium]